MHEFSIALAVTEQISKMAEEKHVAKVTKVTLSIGVISGVEPESLRLVFPFAAEGSVAEGAELVIEQVPVTFHCKACGHQSVKERFVPECDACRSTDLNITAGREMLIKSVECILAAPADAPPAGRAQPL